MSEVRERRLETRTACDRYYSVDFSFENESFLYQFKIWNLSSKGACLLVKEDSSVLDHLKVGDIVNMRYSRADSSEAGEYMKTEIRHITTHKEGRFKGHCLVGISILGDPGDRG